MSSIRHQGAWQVRPQRGLGVVRAQGSDDGTPQEVRLCGLWPFSHASLNHLGPTAALAYDVGTFHHTNLSQLRSVP